MWMGIIISYPRELTDTLPCARPRTYLPLWQQHCNTVKDTAELSGKLQNFCRGTKSAHHACGNDNGMCVRFAREFCKIFMIVWRMVEKVFKLGTCLYLSGIQSAVVGCRKWLVGGKRNKEREDWNSCVGGRKVKITRIIVGGYKKAQNTQEDSTTSYTLCKHIYSLDCSADRHWSWLISGCCQS